MLLNIKSKHIVEKLNESDKTGELKKYPMYFTKNNSRVRVNSDDYLCSDDFIIVSPYANLPREIYLYGKRGRHNSDDNIYLNYWMPIFLKTIENGYLTYDKFEKSNSKYELTVGLPYNFRESAYRNTWTRKNVIEFLSCLFDVKLEEAEFQQQDILEFMAA